MTDAPTVESFDVLLTDAQGNGPFRRQFTTEAERDEWVGNPRNVVNASYELQHVVNDEPINAEILAQRVIDATKAADDAAYLAARDAGQHNTTSPVDAGR